MRKGLITVRVVNRFSIRFSIVFKTIVFETTHSFLTFRKRITIVFENDRFSKNDKRSFFIRLFLKKTIVNEGSSLTIVNKELSLSYMQEKVVGELKLLDIFFKTTQ